MESIWPARRDIAMVRLHKQQIFVRFQSLCADSFRLWFFTAPSLRGALSANCSHSASRLRVKNEVTMEVKDEVKNEVKNSG